MTVTQLQRDAAGRSQATQLIDTDVHEYMKSKESLIPYLSPHWQHYITSYGIDMGPGAPTAWPYAAITPTRQACRTEWVLDDGTMGSDVDALRAHLLDAEKVTTAILNGLFYPSTMKGNFDLATALASAYNDWQAEEWLDKEPRLRGSVQVCTADPQAAAREIDRRGEDPRVVQVLLPLITERQYGDPQYRPIFEAALRNDLVVAFHHSPATETLLGWPRYFIEWHTLAAPQAAMNQLVSMICNGLFDHLADLKVTMLETGVAWLPWFMWRLDGQYKEARTEIPWVKRKPSDHMRDSVRIATQPMGDTQLRDFLQIVERTESDRMFVFSTDYPHYDADTFDTILPEGRVPDELRRRVAYQNVVETYPRLRGLAP